MQQILDTYLVSLDIYNNQNVQKIVYYNADATPTYNRYEDLLDWIQEKRIEFSQSRTDQLYRIPKNEASYQKDRQREGKRDFFGTMIRDRIRSLEALNFVQLNLQPTQAVDCRKLNIPRYLAIFLYQKCIKMWCRCINFKSYVSC